VDLSPRWNSATRMDKEGLKYCSPLLPPVSHPSGQESQPILLFDRSRDDSALLSEGGVSQCQEEIFRYLHALGEEY
jgi:hypothetical protein